MKVNYPIKYVAMPIIEQVGWTPGLHELEREYDVVCYIVSKCYLINDLTRYEEDGHSIKEYEVVFPYQRTEFDKWKRVIPSYNLIHGYCTNSNKIDTVFDSYEEALNYVSNKNEKLCKKSWVYLPYSKDLAQKIQEKKDAFAAKLAEYKILEEQISLNTEDIELGKKKQLDNVIRISNNKGTITASSIYNVLDLYDKDKFVVYNISKEQYSKLVKLIKEEKIFITEIQDDIKSEIGNAEGILMHNTKEGFIKLVFEETVIGYYNYGNIEYSDNTEIITEKDFENIDKDTYVFYTTETVQDIIDSYKKYSEIDLRKIQSKVLKKVKK